MRKHSEDKTKNKINRQRFATWVIYCNAKCRKVRPDSKENGITLQF